MARPTPDTKLLSPKTSGEGIDLGGEKFWKELFQTEPPRLDRLHEFSHPNLPVYSRTQVNKQLSSDFSLALRDWTKQEGTSLSTLLCSAWLILLAKLSDENDISFGFIGTEKDHSCLPIRVSLQNSSLHQLCQLIDGLLTGVQGLRSFRWQWFLSQVWLKHSSRRPLPFQTVFQTVPVAQPSPALLGILRKTDHILSLEERDEVIGLQLDFDDGLFSCHGMSTRLSQLEQLLRSALRTPHLRLEELSFTSTEDEEIYRLCNKTDKSFPQNQTIDQLFSDQAERTPERLALCGRELSLTFREVETLSAGLAQYLRNLFSHARPIIGVHLDRTPESIISLLAIIRAGAQYLPLDPSFPEERLRFMLEDSRASLVLSHTVAPWAENIPQMRITRKTLEELQEPLKMHLSTSDSPFCVMYTSGSTGRPKGVINTHYSTLNCFHWMWQDFPFEEGEVGCQTSSLSFGDSIQEIFGPLLQGVPLVLVSLDTLRNPGALLELLSQKRVTRITLVPSLMERILEVTEDLEEALPYLRLWVTSGEALPRSLAERFLKAHSKARLINLYGASELSNDVTFDEVRRQSIERASRIRIGRPIPNTKIYVVNERGELCPVGVPGELWVSGRGVCPGYLARPELTEDKFIENPFYQAHVHHPDHRRCYRTGDQVALNLDGELEFLGRGDAQIKIAGKRIELEEIEAVLHSHSAVRSAVVTLRVCPLGIRQIVAYLVPRTVESYCLEDIIQFSKSILPDYMIPAIWETMETLPLTGSGKVDRKSLPEPRWDSNSRLKSAEDEQVFDQRELILANLWREVLDFSGPLNKHQSFFDLGGTSLSLMMLIVKIERKFRQSLSSKSVFSNPTIHGMGETLVQASLCPPDSKS